MAGYRCVVVGVDFSEYSREAVRQAIRLVDAQEGKVVLVHVVDMPAYPGAGAGSISGAPLKGFLDRQQEMVVSRETTLQAFAEEFRPQTPVPFVCEVAQGKPAKEILHRAYKNRADLIIVGTRGLSVIDKLLLGSTAEKVVRRAQCSVMVVKLGSPDWNKKR